MASVCSAAKDVMRKLLTQEIYTTNEYERHVEVPLAYGFRKDFSWGISVDLCFVCSMINEWEVAKRFDDAVVVPIERIIAGNR